MISRASHRHGAKQPLLYIVETPTVITVEGVDERHAVTDTISALLYIGRNSDQNHVAKIGKPPRKRKKVAHRVALHLADFSATWKVTQWATYKFLYFVLYAMIKLASFT